jgi:NAD-dependent DNA ligase
MKSVIQRCIGERQDYMQGREPRSRTRVRVHSLAGKRVVFTGGLSLLRAHTKKLAPKAGAIVEDGVSHATDVLVVDDQSPTLEG